MSLKAAAIATITFTAILAICIASFIGFDYVKFRSQVYASYDSLKLNEPVYGINIPDLPFAAVWFKNEEPRNACLTFPVRHGMITEFKVGNEKISRTYQPYKMNTTLNYFSRQISACKNISMVLASNHGFFYARIQASYSDSKVVSIDKPAFNFELRF